MSEKRIHGLTFEEWRAERDAVFWSGDHERLRAYMKVYSPETPTDDDALLDEIVHRVQTMLLEGALEHAKGTERPAP